MSVEFEPVSHVTRLGEASEALAAELRRLSLRGRLGSPAVQRLAVPAPMLDPLDWLGSRTPGSRGLWSPRDERRTVAYWESADSFEGSNEDDFDRLAAYVRHMLTGADSGIRFMGGFRFDTRRAMDELWAPFGAFRFVLPRFEYCVHEQSAELACNVVWPRDRGHLEDLALACDSLAQIAPARAAFPKPVGRADQPERAEWVDRIRQALGSIDENSLQKIVLARRTSFSFSEPLNALAVFRRLRDATPNRFHFYFEAADGRGFLGATPERLFRREGNYLFSEAVAGTRPRVDDEVGDEALRVALLGSEKDQREHLSVRWAIEEILRPFCDVLSVDARASEMRLARGRHLVSRFEAVLRDGIDTWDLVRHLHPTPAVGGYPERAALRAIRESEAFDRGWYAGPVGCVGSGFAEFAVALRCGLVAGSDLHLYSGAGIVAGSEPEAEWDEIEHKIVDFVRSLGLAPEDAS